MKHVRPRLSLLIKHLPLAVFLVASLMNPPPAIAADDNCCELKIKVQDLRKTIQGKSALDRDFQRKTKDMRKAWDKFASGLKNSYGKAIRDNSGLNVQAKAAFGVASELLSNVAGGGLAYNAVKYSTAAATGTASEVITHKQEKDSSKELKAMKKTFPGIGKIQQGSQDIKGLARKQQARAKKEQELWQSLSSIPCLGKACKIKPPKTLYVKPTYQAAEKLRSKVFSGNSPMLRATSSIGEYCDLCEALKAMMEIQSARVAAYDAIASLYELNESHRRALAKLQMQLLDLLGNSDSLARSKTGNAYSAFSVGVNALSVAFPVAGITKAAAESMVSLADHYLVKSPTIDHFKGLVRQVSGFIEENGQALVAWREFADELDAALLKLLDGLDKSCLKKDCSKKQKSRDKSQASDSSKTALDEGITGKGSPEDQVNIPRNWDISCKNAEQAKQQAEQEAKTAKYQRGLLGQKLRHMSNRTIALKGLEKDYKEGMDEIDGAARDGIYSKRQADKKRKQIKQNIKDAQKELKTVAKEKKRLQREYDKAQKNELAANRAVLKAETVLKNCREKALEKAMENPSQSAPRTGLPKGSCQKKAMILTDPITRDMPDSEKMANRAGSGLAGMAKGALLGGMGSGGMFGGGDQQNQMIRPPRGKWIQLENNNGTELDLMGWVYDKRKGKEEIRIAQRISESDHDGVPHTMVLQHESGRILQPIGYMIFELWAHWKLTVTMWRDTYVDGKLVSHEKMSTESFSWDELLESYVQVVKGPAIWERLGGRPYQGIKGIIAQYQLPERFNPAEWSLVSHVTGKEKSGKKSMLKTEPFVVNLTPTSGRTSEKGWYQGRFDFSHQANGRTRYQTSHACE